MNTSIASIAPHGSDTPPPADTSSNITCNSLELREVERHEAPRMRLDQKACKADQAGLRPQSLFERCKHYITRSIHLHLRNLINDVLNTTTDFYLLVKNNDWMTLNKFLTPIECEIEIDYLPLENWISKIFCTTLSDIFSTWPEERRNELEEQLNILMSCLDAHEINAAHRFFNLLHQMLKQNIWIKPTNEFTPIADKRPGGSAPEMQFFQDSKGNRWLGKCGPLALYDHNQLLWEIAGKDSFISPYADEILEKLGLAIYQLVGVRVPESALSYQPVTEEVAIDFECFSPRMHYLSRWMDNFEVLGPHFVSDYLSRSKTCGNEYVTITTRSGEELPLKGLGSMLAAADFLYDLDCIGNQGGNAGYVIEADSQTGSRYAQVVKIDAGHAFSYYSARHDQPHDPRKRTIRIRPNEGMLDFAILAPADQRDFANVAKHILSIPRSEYAYFFSQAEHIDEGIPKQHIEALLDGLIARKNLFLKAFASETNRSITNEIEEAQAKVARKMESKEEISSEAIKQFLAQEGEESQVLAAMRASLALAEVRGSEPKNFGECKTFQLPNTTAYFVGRLEAIATIVKQLNQTHSNVAYQSIIGIGGIGKTQLALHYAQAAANREILATQYLDYDYVIWLNAETFLEGQFQTMAEAWIGHYLKADEAIEAVYRFLRGKRTLLVFDNAENARSIAAFLPPLGYPSSIHILITSHTSQWGEIPTIKLEGFCLEEACKYVDYHLGPQPPQAVKQLLELLDGLPLAMSHAVSYIRAGHSTIEGFGQQFYLNQANLLSHDLLPNESHPKTVGTTLTLALAKAKVQSPIAEKVLGVIAYLSPECIEMELIENALYFETYVEAAPEFKRENISETSQGCQIGNAIKELRDAIEILSNYSLISLEEKNVQVHRLVQEVMRHRHKFLKEPHSYWNKVVRLLNSIVFYDETDIEGMRHINYAIPHVKQIGKLGWALGLNKEQELTLAYLLGVSGLHQGQMGNYELKKDLLERSLSIMEEHYGRDHEEVAITLVNLGNAHGSLGNARMHKELLERALRIKEERYGANHLEVTRALVGLGNAYSALGNARMHKELLERALSIEEANYGKDHVEVAKTLVSLGNAYGTLGDVRKEIELLERALEVLVGYYGREHVQVARALGALSNAYGVLGNVHKKKDLLERVLVTLENFYGKKHVEVARTLVNLGNAYGILGHARKTKCMLERALGIFEDYYGKEHVQVARILNDLGNVYGDFGDLQKKKELLERALGIEEQSYGKDHVEVAKTLVNLSNVYGESGNFRKKKELLERALNIEEQYYGKDHVEVARTLVNLGNVYGESGDIRRKKELLERALAMLESYYDEEHVEVAITLRNLGNAYGELKDYYTQKELLERALVILEAIYGNEHVEVARTLGSLGNVYGDLGVAYKQKELLERALAIFERCYSPTHGEVAITLTNLGNAYGALRKPHKQKKLLERAVKLKENFYGKEHVETAITLGNLALTYLTLGYITEANSYAQKTYLIFRQFYGEHHQNTMRALTLFQKCAERLLHNPVSTNSFDFHAPALYESIHQEAIAFFEAISAWVEYMEQILNTSKYRYHTNTGSYFVGIALQVLANGSWQQLLKDPHSYGVPETIAIALEQFLITNPILLKAKFHPAVDELSIALLKNGFIDQEKEQIGYQRTSEDQESDYEMPALIE